MIDIKDIAEKLINFAANKVNELIKVLKPSCKKKPLFDVIISEAGPCKLHVVKDVYTFCNCGLKEARDLVDHAPSTLKENIPEKEAKNLKKIIESSGAKVTLRDRGKKTPF